MSKKSNTFLFILGATVFNILVTVGCIFILLLLYAKLLMPLMPQEAAAVALPVIFIGAIALSFVLYRVVLKQIMKRIKMEDHFDPLFGSRRGLKR
jgi:hypothetical protein